MSLTFLTAEWKNLIMANYIVEAPVLERYLPSHTELDFYEGQCFVSLVGFMFVDTKVMGIPIPFHRHFEEVNLRFYVRHKDGEAWKRGTVFIKEIVPKPAITFVANTLYHEHYVTMHTRHRWGKVENGNLSVEYSWKTQNGVWNRMMAEASPFKCDLAEGSEEEFITEHYWGYTKLPGGGTSEYQVEHPRWAVHPVHGYEINVEGELLYGKALGKALSQRPHSVLLASGSEVVVRKGRRLIF